MPTQSVPRPAEPHRGGHWSARDAFPTDKAMASAPRDMPLSGWGRGGRESSTCAICDSPRSRTEYYLESYGNTKTRRGASGLMRPHVASGAETDCPETRWGSG